MNSNIPHSHTGTSNWRKALRQNQRRTNFVILTFILIYLTIGVLIDLYIYAGYYPGVPLSQLTLALLTFQIIPKATVITVSASVILLFITFSFNHKLSLLGTEYREINPDTAETYEEKVLYNIVEELKLAAALHFMPKVYVIEADYMNAFASGYNEKSAMVAITRGLLYKLDRSELEAVMAHELSHIRHMDIRLTMMASILTNILLIVVDLFFFSIVYGENRSQESGSRNPLFVLVLVLRYLMPMVTMILMLFLSRTREYMADAGCVELMRDNEPLARALIKIQNDHTENQERYVREYTQTPHENVRQAAYIFDPFESTDVKPNVYDPLTVGLQPKRSLMSDFFSTHPSLEKRLAAIGYILKK